MTSSAEAASAFRRALARLFLEALVVVAVFAGVGAACGWLWFKLWTPPQGGVQDGEWLYLDLTEIGQVFDATGLYAVIGLAGGLALGVLASLLARRSELVTLAAVAVGSALAAFLCYRVGVHLGPPDPAILAASAPEGTLLPGNLSLSGKSPYVVWSLGGLVGLAVTYFLLTSRSEVQHREDHDADWLARNQVG